MKSFWMVQYVIAWVGLILASTLRYDWWLVCLNALFVLGTGYRFGQMCVEQDKKQASSGVRIDMHGAYFRDGGRWDVSDRSAS